MLKKKASRPEVNQEMSKQEFLEQEARKQEFLEQEARKHPLYPIFIAAIQQAMYGKGERHGGNQVPFMKQDWVRLAEAHGRGFLTGQACKKLTEAAETRDGHDFETEALGAIVYAGMSVIHERIERGDIPDVEE